MSENLKAALNLERVPSDEYEARRAGHATLDHFKFE
jgi:hypothetical protein